MKTVLKFPGSSKIWHGSGAFPAEIPTTAKPNHHLSPSFPRNPLSPPSDPVQRRLQSPPAKNKFLAVGLGEIAMLPVFAFLAIHFQKHRLASIGLSIAAIGYLASWFFYTPDKPYLQLVAYLPANLGLCACWLLNGSMMADICDDDELRSGQRREGMFSAVFAICYKGGIAFGALFGGYLLKWSGVTGEKDSSADVVSLPAEVIENIRLAYLLPPALCFLGAAGIMLAYPLTKSRMKEIRAALDNQS